MNRHPPTNLSNLLTEPAPGLAVMDAIEPVDVDLARLQRWFSVTKHDRSVGIFERNLDTGEAVWDDRLCALSGFPPGTPASRFEDFVASVLPSDRARLLALWSASAQSMQPVSAMYRMRRADGDVRTMQVDWIVQPDAAGQRIAAGTVRDVTELESERNEAEVDRAQLLLAADVARVGLIRQELATGRLVVNAAARSIFGLPAGGPVDLDALLARLHPDDRPLAARSCGAPRPAEQPWQLRCRVVTADDRVRHVEARSAWAPGGFGEPPEQLFAVIDVTEAVEAEARERRLAQSRTVALDVADVGVWEATPVWQADGTVQWTQVFDDRLSAMYGRSASSEPLAFGDWLELVHPDDRGRLRDLEGATLHEADAARSAEYRIRRADGAWRWLRSSWTALRDGDGRVSGLIGASRDITGNRELEARLRDERDLLAATQRLARVGTWRRLIATGQRYWSPQQYAIFRRDPALGPPSSEELVRYFEPSSWAQLERCMALDLDSTTEGEFILRIWRDDGTTGIVRSWTERVDDEHGRPIEFRGCQQDITETEAMRREVDSVRLRLQALFDEAINGMLLADDEARYVDANPAACQILGYTREELLGLRVSDVYVSDEAEPFDELWHRYIDERRQWGRVRVRRKDGRVIPIEYSAVADFQRGLHLSVFSDISQRLETEQALFEAQTRLRELTLRQEADFEAMRAELARDVHDELGQTLGALKLEVESIVAALPPQVAAQLDVGRAQRLLGTAVGQVRDIARALRSPVLDLGLSPALRALGADLSMRGDVDVVVEVPDAALAGLERSTSEVIYRIAQEGLTNAMRHADARVVRVALRPVGDRQLMLEVSDDGCGFDPSGASARTGLGLLGMRERAHQIGAELRVDSAPGAGTRVRLQVTPKEWRQA